MVFLLPPNLCLATQTKKAHGMPNGGTGTDQGRVERNEQRKKELCGDKEVEVGSGDSVLNKRELSKK